MQATMGDKLINGEEILFRQIHPNSLESGEPGSDRFRPTLSDKNMLSTDRSSLTTAAASHALYTSTGRLSAAVFGLSVSEFECETIACFEDPINKSEPEPENLAHALANYSLHGEKAQKLVAKRLKRLAVARGCLLQSAT